jgi:hypothetical protein
MITNAHLVFPKRKNRRVFEMDFEILRPLYQDGTQARSIWCVLYTSNTGGFLANQSKKGAIRAGMLLQTPETLVHHRRIIYSALGSGQVNSPAEMSAR